MKKYSHILIIGFVLFMFVLFIPSIAFADNDDFDVTYTITPNPVGPDGGDVQLRLSIQNTGSTDITWTNVVINTKSTFNEVWRATILDGRSRTISYIVPISKDDINKNLIMQVSMNNNSSANPDGVKHYTIRINGNDSMYDVSFNFNPNQSSYQVGDSVNVSMRLQNDSPTHALTNITNNFNIRTHGVARMTEPIDTFNKSSLFPGAEENDSFSYTFTEADIGTNTFYTSFMFTYSNQVNLSDKDIKTFEVTSTAAEPETAESGGSADIDFEVYLNVNRPTGPPGGLFKFFVELYNVGEDRIDTYEIRNSSGQLETSTESMASGDNGITTIEKNLDESGDFRFVVTAITDDTSVTRTSNTVSVTIPIVEEAPEETPEPTIPTEEPETESVDAPQDVPVDDDQDNNLIIINKQDFIIYGLIGLIIIILIISIIVLLKFAAKNKKKTDES